MGPIQVVVQDGNNLVLEVTPTPNTTVILDRGIAGPPGPTGTGDVDGPASATDNAVARFDGTTGKLIQNSVVLVGDTGAVSGVTDLTASGAVTLSGGTANGVAYLNGSKVLTTGSALTFDGTNFASTGIISSTNTNGLRAQYPSSAGYYAQLDSRDGNTYLSAVGSTAAIVFRATDGPGTTAEGMRLTSTGLGIGTSSPSQKLDINGGASDTYLKLTGSSRNAFIGQDGTGLAIIQAGNAPIYFNTNATERMRLDSSGNLGLGVTPSAWSVITALEMPNGTSLGAFSSSAIPNTYLGTNNFYNGTNFIYKVSGFAALQYRMASTGNHEWYTAPSGTAGNAISFTQAMTLTAAGDLGVGTTSPGSFDSFANNLVVGTGSGSEGITIYGGSTDSSNLSFADGTGAASYQGFIQYSHAADSLGFWVNYSGSSSPRLTIDSSGNVGIGTSSPARKLSVSGSTAYARLTDTDTGGSGSVEAAIEFYANDGQKASIGYPGNDDFILNVVDNKNLRFWTNNTERARITSGGDFLVGSTSVPSAVANYRSLVVGGVTGGIVDMGTTSTSYGRVSADSVGLNLESLGATTTIFRTNGSERARITSGGDLLIGTTSASGNGERLNVTGSSTSFIAYVDNTSTGARRGIISTYSGSSPPNDTGNEFIYCNDLSAVRMTVRSNGGIANFSGNDVNLSDRREKTNFAPAKSYLDTICAIPVQTFNYIDQNLEEDGGLTLGVVAQDVQAVAPELVMESNWGTQDEPKQRLSIYQTDLQYALMKCIQEQQAIITALTARVAALESN